MFNLDGIETINRYRIKIDVLDLNTGKPVLDRHHIDVALTESDPPYLKEMRLDRAFAHVSQHVAALLREASCSAES